MKKIIGYIILSSPFIAIAVFMIVNNGWKTAAFVFGLAALAVALIYYGVYLTK